MFYSAANNSFYAPSLRADYERKGTWPADAIKVDDRIYDEFARQPAPAGKHRVAGPDGLPMWEDDALPTSEEIIVRQIVELEASVTPRRMREAVLTESGAQWLADVEQQIAALRSQL